MVAKVISGREVAETILTTDLKNKVIELNKKNEGRKKLYFSAIASTGLILFGLFIF